LPPLPIQNGQWDDAAEICAKAQRTHTAARPSRIFTVFPFHYPAEKHQPDLNMLLFIIKERTGKIAEARLIHKINFFKNLQTAESE
jgi:hypothetical protein